MVKHFDELAKALASGMPRRVALRRFAGGLVGAAMAAAIPGRAALAAPSGKGGCAAYCLQKVGPGAKLGTCINECVNECTHICEEVFADDGVARARCIDRSLQCPPGTCAAIDVNITTNGSPFPLFCHGIK